MSYNVSSYWLDDRLDHETKEDKKDPLRLSAYRNAIANFVSIVTGENIPVTFKKSGSSFTNGKEVTISSRLGDKDFDHTVGLALHEGSHIKLTNFDVLKRLEDWIWSGKRNWKISKYINAFSFYFSISGINLFSICWRFEKYFKFFIFSEFFCFNTRGNIKRNGSGFLFIINWNGSNYGLWSLYA